MKILIATHNEDKVKEMLKYLNDPNFEFVTLKMLGDEEEVFEGARTLSGNAHIKALHYFHKYNLPVIADDSGLFVDALHGAPGVYSARYADDVELDNNGYLLKNMEGKENRDAYFSCLICLFTPYNDIVFFNGRIDGIILQEERGKKGFGYDPLFYIPEYQKTFGEMDIETKNKISHRGQALICLKKFLLEEIKNEFTNSKLSF